MSKLVAALCALGLSFALGVDPCARAAGKPSPAKSDVHHAGRADASSRGHEHAPAKPAAKPTGKAAKQQASKSSGKGADHKSKTRSHRPEPPSTEPDETTPRVAEHPDDPHERRIADLRRHLDELVHERPLKGTRIGVTVMNAQDGDLLYAHNAERQFNPASNTKILTTAAALVRLGGDWRYLTTVHGPLPDDEGVVHGNVELRGSGDPALTIQGVGELARSLAERGIKRIEGDLITDGKFRLLDAPHETFGGGALIVNKNAYTVHIMPTSPRKDAIVSVEPRSPEYFQIDNKVTTVKGKKTRITLDGYRSENRFVVVARGRINPRDDVRLKAKLPDGAMYSAAILRRALVDFGVEVTGKLHAGGLDGDAPVLAAHRSIPLSDICRISNKDSNNFVADTIFKTLGRECYGGPASMQKGVRAVDETLAPIGLGSSSYHIVNGSGLSHENRIQPVSLARLLRSLFLDLSVAPDFLTSLAVGGIDGTIKNRFRGEIVGRVRAKTGTLSNVSALSGYVGDTGDVLIFTILIDNFHHRSLEEVRGAQVMLVRQMMAYLRAERPNRPPNAPVPVLVPIDDADTEDADDDEGEGALEGAGQN